VITDVKFYVNRLRGLEVTGSPKRHFLHSTFIALTTVSALPCCSVMGYPEKAVRSHLPFYNITTLSLKHPNLCICKFWDILCLTKQQKMQINHPTEISARIKTFKKPQTNQNLQKQFKPWLGFSEKPCFFNHGMRQHDNRPTTGRNWCNDWCVFSSCKRRWLKLCHRSQ